ncbi:hypothetical protein, partial [Aeromonas rivipollensis]|uniref:TRAFAC clade GTPase domain-containing protein n=1 Tax=Aeromonas rivipollensis TaxID=948519 RepID=UPI003D248FFA
MSSSDNSILLIGESDVGKTHYGAQLLKRLMKRDGQLRMNGAATNLEPFESAMSCLDEGMAAGHTAASTYVDSIWPITDAQGRREFNFEVQFPIKNQAAFRSSSKTT